MKKILIALVGACLIPVLALTGSTRGMYAVEHGFSTSGFDIRQGRSIFVKKCARCHNVNGSSIAAGPNLSQLGGRAGNRKVGRNAAEYILESILKPREFKTPGTSGEMPVGLVSSYDDDAVRDLVAYLCSLGGPVEDNTIRSLVIERPDFAKDDTVYDSRQVIRGEQLYRGKGGCAACHPFYGGTGHELLAPYLFYRGFRDKAELLQAITKPHDKISPKYHQTTVLLLNGKTVIGRLISQSEAVVIILVRDKGVTTRRTIAISDIDTDADNTLMIEQQVNVSDMPSGFDQLLTADELECVVQFLLISN